MNISNITQETLQTIKEQAFTIGLGLLVILLLIYLARDKIKHSWLNHRTRRCLKQLGHKQLANVRWPDGLGHYFIIDRLILRQDGITLLRYNQYPGKIFCADNIDDWTQMIGQKSYRFKNPLHELDYQVKTVAASIPDVSVDGVLFFDHLAEFPKGHPERVIHLKKIPEELKRNEDDTIDKSVDSAWKELVTRTRI